jgi:CheY-like chemotaxis protein
MPNGVRAGTLVETHSTNHKTRFDERPTAGPAVGGLGGLACAVAASREVAGDVCCDADQVIRRCLIVDDNERFLAVAHASLEREGLEVVGTAKTIAEALTKVDVLRPDVVLVDIGLGQESGFELARQVVESHPELRARIVLISTRCEEDFAELITASPAAGFLCKVRLSARAVRELVARGCR